MFTLIYQAGLFGTIIALLIILVVLFFILSLRCLIKFKSENYNSAEENINNILRMGILSAAIGLLGTMFGGYQMLNAIWHASDISMEIVWGGIVHALSAVVLGLEVFVISAIVWFILRVLLKRQVQ